MLLSSNTDYLEYFGLCLNQATANVKKEKENTQIDVKREKCQI